MNNPASSNLPKRGPGRPKGSPNKITSSAKFIIEGAAEAIGGMARLAVWAKESPENERAFWAQIFPKLLPLQVDGQMDMRVTWPVSPPRVDR